MTWREFTKSRLLDQGLSVEEAEKAAHMTEYQMVTMKGHWDKDLKEYPRQLQDSVLGCAFHNGLKLLADQYGRLRNVK